MPVVPNFLERVMLLRLNRGPAPILDLFGGAGFKSVALALKLNLFQTLAESAGSLTADALAEQTDADPEGIATLCEFLVTERYLAEDGGRYQLTEMTEKWLLAESKTNLGPWLTFWNDIVFPFWDQELEQAIRHGAPSQSLYEWLDAHPARWQTAQDGFRASASLLLDDVIKAVTVTRKDEHLIDIGGGHGLYAMELSRQYPHLSATIFDVPRVVEEITADIPPELAGQVDTKPGDYLTDDLGEGYDLALLFNVVHAHDPDENVTLFKRVGDALAPGGRIVVLDQWEGTGRTPIGRTGLRFVALTYLTTLGGSIYGRDGVSSWLQRAGFFDIRHQSVGPIAGMAIIEGTKG